MSAPADQHPPPFDTGAGPYLSVVAPCYNEEEVLPEFHRRVTAVCQGMPGGYELVLVDDGSTDRTWSTLQTLVERDARLVAVKLARHHGQALALAAGLSVCRGQRVLIIDADLQDPPELLPEMMRLMDGGVDVVYGQRRRRAGENPLKIWGASVFYRLLNWLADWPVPPDTGDFRLISRRVLELLQAMPEPRRFTRGMISWLGFRQVALPFDRAPRYGGQTKWPLRKRRRLAWEAIISCSTWPLRLPWRLGAALGIGGLALVVSAVATSGSGGSAPWFLGLLAAIALVGAAQFFVLGLLGEYLERIHEQTRGRPLFVIETICRQAADTAAMYRQKPPPDTRSSDAATQ